MAAAEVSLQDLITTVLKFYIQTPPGDWGTVQHIHATLRVALGQAERWGLIARNVATLVGSPRVPRAEIQPFTPEQARRFLESIRGDRLEALYSVAMAVGLRQGEGLGLRWPDIDMGLGRLAVNHALQRVDGKLQLVETERGHSRRTMMLPQLSLATPSAHRACQEQQRLLAGERSGRNRITPPSY